MVPIHEASLSWDVYYLKKQTNKNKAEFEKTSADEDMEKFQPLLQCW